MATPVIMPKLEMAQETATIAEWLKQDQDWVRAHVTRIGETTRENLAIAEQKGITTAAAALHQAKARIHKAE